MFRFFLYSVAAVRPSTLTLVSPFLFSYAHGRYAIIGRFPYRERPVALRSRDFGCFRITCHRPAYLYVSLFFSCDFYCTSVCHGDSPRLSLCHAYVFSLMLLTHLW